MNSGVSREHLTHLLQSCTHSKTLSQLHSLLLRLGLLSSPDCFFATNLTSSYSKLKPPDLLSARQLFDETPHPNVFLFNSILRAHSRSRQWPDALLLFSRMTVKPDPFTLPVPLKACAALAALPLGRAIHSRVVKTPFARSDTFVAAALVEMYAKCGQMGDAIKVFDEVLEPDCVLWTSVVSGYQQNGLAEEAMAFFKSMVVGNGWTPDKVTVVSLVSAITQLGDVRGGKCCHGFLIRMGFDSDLLLVNALLNLYAKVGDVGSAVRLFGMMHCRDVITWSCMIACYAHNGRPVDALHVYKKMSEVGLKPNLVTLISVIQACALALDLEEGRRAHELAIEKGFELDAVVSTSLIDMYMKCSCYDEAMDLFCQLPKKDVVAWAAVVSGCAQNGFPSEALKLFLNMLYDGAKPDAVMIVKVLAACSQLGVLRQALCFHGYLVQAGFDNKVFVCAALIDLYSKCGRLDDAVQAFESIAEKDVVLWTSMIAGYGIHGLGVKAIATFNSMIESSIRPNDVTFVSVLSACSHTGLVAEGRRIFYSMSCVYGVAPNSEHCGIMVDLLSRNGELHEAMRTIKGMSGQVDPHVWCAMLAGCKIHRNIEMGELVAKKLLEIEPSHAGYYNLLSNMYAFDGRWDHMTEVKNLIKDRGLRKTPGYSSVEIGNQVYTFLAGERLSEKFKEIHALVAKLKVIMMDEICVAGWYMGDASYSF